MIASYYSQYFEMPHSDRFLYRVSQSFGVSMSCQYYFSVLEFKNFSTLVSQS